MGVFILGIIAIIAIFLFGSESEKEKQREGFKIAGIILLVFIGIPVTLIIGFIVWAMNS